MSGNTRHLLITDHDSHYHWLNDDELEELLTNPVEAGVRRFLTAEEVTAEPDPARWRRRYGDGTAAILRVEVLYPRPVTTAWELP